MAKNKGTLHTMDILGRREMKIRKWKQLFLVLLCAAMIITQIPIEALANSAQSSENTVMSEENQEDKQEIPIDKEQNHKQNPKAIQEEIVAAEETEKPKASEEDLEKNNPLEEELKDSGQPEEEQINPEEGKDSQPEEGEEKEETENKETENKELEKSFSEKEISGNDLQTHEQKDQLKEEEKKETLKSSQKTFLQKNSVTGAASEGTFVLAAFSQDTVLIEPVAVSYESNDTLKSALLKTWYKLEGLETDFLQKVEDIEGNYSIVLADGSFLMDTPADKVETLFISERNDVNTQTDPQLVAAVSEALKVMEAYNASTNNLQQFKKAAEAYNTLLTHMRTADANGLGEKINQLKEAVKEYEDYLVSQKRKVTLRVTQGGAEVTDAHLEFTDQYGNTTKAEGSEIELADGLYTFVVRDSKAPYNFTTNVGKLNAKSGGSWNVIDETFTVSESSTELQVKLASGEWFGEITAEANNSKALDSKRTEHDKNNHKYVFYVADSFSGNVKPTFKKGTTTPTKDNGDTLSSVDIAAWVDFIYATGNNAGKKVSKVQTSSSNTNKVTFGSARSCLNFIGEGMIGNTIHAEIKWLDDAAEDKTGYIVTQGYELEVKRFPTLTSLGVKDSAGTELISTFDAYEYTYDISTISDTFSIEALPYNAEYSVTLKAGENTEVKDKAVSLNGDKGSFSIVVEAQKITTVYNVNLTKAAATEVTLSMEEGVKAQVFSASGSLLAPKEESTNLYALVPGEAYTYVGTKEEYYHTKAVFIAGEKETIEVATPEVKTVIEDFAVYDSSNKKTRISYQWNKAFTKGEYNYTWYIPDVKKAAALYVQATSSDSEYTYWVSHKNQTTTASQADKQLDWTKKNITSTHKVNPDGTALSLGNSIVSTSGQSNELKLQVRKEDKTAGVIYYQEFVFDLVKILTLKDLSLTAEEGKELTLINKEGEALPFDREIFEYHAKVGAATQKITLLGEFQNTENTYSFDGGYYALVDGQRYDDIGKVEHKLDVNKNSESVEIQICHRDSKAVSQTYKIILEKERPIKVRFKLTPGNALVYLVNQLDNSTVYGDENGGFTIMPEVPYTYTISAAGYKTLQKQDFTLAPLDQDENDEKIVEITLEEVPASGKTLPNYDAQWPTFRADNNGNGVISSKTPIDDEDAVLYWANKIGQGYDTGATGCPILVDGYLFTYAGKAIVKVDTITGEVVASGTMCSSSSFAINSPTYAEGMLFVGLSGGRVQAFNAETLESLWVYTDPKGGQPNCPIKYHDGHIYTGFWNSENKPANFVCISVTDEDPANSEEEKLASWRYTHNGFYWAGAYTGEEFILVGTDDGEQGYTKGHSSVLSFDPATGKLIDEIVLDGVGDLRSEIMYDEHGTKDYYFTTKGGHFYRLQVNEDGTFKNIMSLTLDNYANSTSTPPMSTSTPVIYNGRAYIGVSGTGQFGAYSGHNITVIDLASWSIAYKVRTQGYPQTSGLLTTAYEKENGYVYVYFIDNYTPGKIRILADKPGLKEAIETTKEADYDVAKVLFTPVNAQAQYAICSPVADENGVIYFKNDSAHMMALGPAIEDIEVTAMPKRTVYAVGDKFDKGGMVVTARYSNGTTKDITKYISYSEEPLTEKDTEFTITFPHVMYRDKDGEAGVEYPVPATILNLQVGLSKEDGEKPGSGQENPKEEEPKEEEKPGSGQENPKEEEPKEEEKPGGSQENPKEEEPKEENKPGSGQENPKEEEPKEEEKPGNGQENPKKEDSKAEIPQNNQKAPEGQKEQAQKEQGNNQKKPGAGEKENRTIQQGSNSLFLSQEITGEVASVTKQKEDTKNQQQKDKLSAKAQQAHIQVTEEKAKIEIEAIEQLIRNRAKDAPITLSLTKDKTHGQKVKNAELSADSLEMIAESNSDFMVEFEEIKVKFEEKTLKTIAEQVKEGTVELRVISLKKHELHAKQQKALEEYHVQLCVTAQIFHNGTYIGDFNGGKAKIYLPFVLEPEKREDGYKAYHIADSGEMTRMPCFYENGYMIIETPHFSDFVLIYEESTGAENTIIEGNIVTGGTEQAEKLPIIPMLLIVVSVVVIAAFFLYKKRTNE